MCFSDAQVRLATLVAEKPQNATEVRTGNTAGEPSLRGRAAQKYSQQQCAFVLEKVVQLRPVILMPVSGSCSANQLGVVGQK